MLTRILRFLALPAVLFVALTESLIAAPAPIKLYDLPTARFVAQANGQVFVQRGMLAADGTWRLISQEPVLSTVSVPIEARDRLLITEDQWASLNRLSDQALDNYICELPGLYLIGARYYMDVAARPGAKLDDGKLINVSTRGLASTAEKLIAGFVVTEQSRRVLVRAVGPGLAAFGVANAMVDPRLTLQRAGAPASEAPLATNGDWNTRADADAIRTGSAAVGAFALAANSRDAALIIELPPGGYTVQVEPETGGAGVALVEVYRLP